MSANNNGGMGQLLTGIVVALLVAMFFAGGFMIAESTGDNQTMSDDGKTGIVVEPKKMYFGIVMLIAAAFLAMLFVYQLYKSTKNTSYSSNYNKGY
jgi:TRAP-type C4-dicarboxylate transport system permease small subunit